MELAERKKLILSAIVKRYISTGEPVGSKLVASETGMGLSSATIRNEMSELAEMGYLEQPHTSAGRVPTQRGYRIYVDQLMEKYHLTQTERTRIERLLHIDGGDVETTLSLACKLLADLTGCTSLSTAPADKSATVRHIEMVASGRRQLVFVILTSSGVIKSRLCRIEEDLTPDMLSFFSQLINDNFADRKLETITPEFVKSVEAKLYEYTYALSPVVELIVDEIKSIDSEVFLGGAANLIANRELDSNSAATMIKFLEQRDALMHIIGGIPGGVKVRIGLENGMEFMQNSSIIAAPYAFQGRICGAVGIIGPTRMNYARMMSSLEYFSVVLSRLINYNFGDHI